MEKEVNILVGNHYFGEKQKKYKESSNTIVQDFVNLPLTDWGLENVLQRDNIVCDEIIEILEEWSK